MTALPTELWLIIFEIVIEEGITRLDQCDYTTFAYIQTFLSSEKHRYRFHGSYFRLRLVCRNFNAILSSALTDYFPDSTAFPFPPSTRSLYLDFPSIGLSDFRRFFAEPSSCGRLALSTGVRRLTLRVLNEPFDPWWEYFFWTRLRRAFPRLVILIITAKHKNELGHLFLSELGEDVVTLESLEILYLGEAISYSGCHFPRLLHASIGTAHLEGFKLSSHLESLLVYPIGGRVTLDVRLFPCLKLLGIMDHHLDRVVPLDWEHPLEHLRVFLCEDSISFEGVLEKFPGISRITVDLSLATAERRRQHTEEFRRMNLVSIGLSIRQATYDNPIIGIERTNVKNGILNKVWSMMRR